MNQITITGRIAREPELRNAPKGSAVAAFSVANSRNWKTESGEKKEEVSFFDVTAFGRQAEVIAQYFKKGNPILVTGRLRQETWTDKQTQAKRSKVAIVLEGFEFMGGNKDGEDQAAKPEAKTKTDDPAPGRNEGAGGNEDDKVPFN